ncbi:acyl carrier protein [Methanofollis formosanus]|uniref:Acyl carrier protein n=1 Tax=Methanofollis formosanus TaxID=299308 RepID=A0A8G1A377_9EURY|nr:acyl carrier protein [Methanofollis formosanus]QYZ79898.1 acyl carrier protein [Methanofollis formosanus]
MSDDQNAVIKRIFCEVLGVDESEVDDSTSYNSFRPWDSLKHLQLISNFEDEFDIEFEVDDIIAMENFALVKEIVTRYIRER